MFETLKQAAAAGKNAAEVCDAQLQMQVISCYFFLFLQKKRTKTMQFMAIMSIVQLRTIEVHVRM